MPVLFFHTLQLACDLLALARLRRARTLAWRLAALGLALAGCLALAALGMALETGNRYYGSYFTFLGLTAQGIFGHGIPFLVVAGVRGLRQTRGFALACLALAGLLVAVGVEGFVLGPRALTVTHEVVRSPELDRPLRLVVLSDLQTDHVGAWERRVVRAALAERPDVLLLPGDYLQTDERRMPALRALLHELLVEEGFRAPLGIYAVEGNVDRPGWPAIFEGLGATTFVETGSVDVGPLRLTGLSFHDTFDTRLALPAEERFHVVLGHAPDFALGTPRADLLIAGHTHGGQVRLPWLGPLLTLSRVPRSWAAGRVELSGGGTLIVSRGVGMERGMAPPVRFLCPPELVVIDLVPEPSE